MKNMLRGFLALAVVVTVILVATFASSDSFAMFPRRGRFFRVDPHHFYVRDFGLWRGGRWFHGEYAGGYGWWWIVGSTWYFYDRPLYPYPSVTVAPVYYVDVPAGEAPPVTVVSPPLQQAPSALTPPPPAPVAPPVAQYFHCSNPEGFYPYVQTCNVSWNQVPATPPGFR